MDLPSFPPASNTCPWLGFEIFLQKKKIYMYIYTHININKNAINNGYLDSEKLRGAAVMLQAASPVAC